jgi:predicted DNA-binding transcriptional regulator AlpA
MGDDTAATNGRSLATARPWCLLGISRSQCHKLKAQGRTPPPIYLGSRRPVYVVADLAAWLAAGADREEWERLNGRRERTG